VAQVEYDSWLVSNIERRGTLIALRAAVVILLLLTGNAWSQARDAARADQLFREGRELAAAGKLAEACPKFAESYRSDPANGTLMNLTDCEEKTGRLVNATAHWRQLVDAFTKTNDARLTHAQQRLQAAEKRVARLSVRLARSAPPDSKVVLDGTEIALVGPGSPGPVDPGAHEIVVSAPGHADRTYPLKLRNGERHELAVEPGAAAGVAAAAAAGPAPRTSRRFPGAPPLAANDALWILVDGGDAATGSARTIDAAERFGRDVLGLVPNRSLFRISAPSKTFAQLEAVLGKNGPVVRAAGEIKPSVVVFMIVGGAGAAGPTFGGTALQPAWIGERLADLRAASPDSLIVAPVEPLPRSAPEEILTAADASSAPLHLLAGCSAGPNGTAVSAESYVAEIGRLDKETAALVPDLTGLFQGQADAPVALVSSLFLTALAGAAVDPDGLGYDINEVATWVTSTHGRVAHRLERGGKRPGDAVSRGLWPGDESDAASRYPLKRAKIRIGVCASASDLLPATANESFDAQLKRTRTELKSITDAVGVGARSKLQNAPDAIQVESSPAWDLPDAALPAPRVCSAPGRRSLYDAWVFVNHQKDGRYLFTVERVTTGEIVASNPQDPLPDAAKARALLQLAGQHIVGPEAVVAPIPQQSLPAIEAVEAVPGIVFLVDRSFSNSDEKDNPKFRNAEGWKSDPHAKNRLAVFSRIVEAVGQRAAGTGSASPYAVISFGDAASVLTSGGAHWFRCTDPVDPVRRALAIALTDDQQTNLGDAIAKAGLLMAERPEVKTWHVILMSDGQPTVGVLDKGLTEAAGKAFQGKATLSAFSLFASQHRAYANEVLMQGMVQNVADGAGRRGLLVSVRNDVAPQTWFSRADEVALLISRSTVRTTFRVPCTGSAGVLRCEVRSKQDDRVRLGALKEAMFVFGAAGFTRGKCQISLTNQGLPGGFSSIDLPEGQQEQERNEHGVVVKVRRGEDRIYLHLRSASESLNGDWGVSVLLGAGGTPP
jgi:hypothetical protein